MSVKNADPEPDQKPPLMLQEAINMFLSQHKETSAKTYGSNLKIVAGIIGPLRTVDTITALHILDVHAYITDKARKYKNPTQAKYVKTTRTFFNWLVKHKFLKESPASFLKAPKVDPYVDPEKAMTDLELGKILDFARWKPRDFALILFLADSGARAGGAAGLRWKDIRWTEKRAMVTEKGNKTRPVAFGETCLEALKRWQQRRPKTAGDYVFSPRKTPMLAACISQVITRACVAVEGRPLGSHSLRHRKGHQFAATLEAPTTAALAMGHSDVMITLGAYYPQGWARTEEALRALTVRSIEDLMNPPETPQTPPPAASIEPEKKVYPPLTVLKGRLSTG